MTIYLPFSYIFKLTYFFLKYFEAQITFSQKTSPVFSTLTAFTYVAEKEVAILKVLEYKDLSNSSVKQYSSPCTLQKLRQGNNMKNHQHIYQLDVDFVLS